ncbi:unnamed protein product [Fraxinus pennsylvanica]|uniref:Cytochrome P450 n=1 Tax=Fraxinus pennsylvanica TaxID=56036 RepID=A0AAD1ZY86_9LAMI|nr:unnamed protein product [Fraxinus pennsylvanica]
MKNEEASFHKYRTTKGCHLSDSIRSVALEHAAGVRFMTGREASKILLKGKDGLVSLNLFHRKAGPWDDKLASTDGRSSEKTSPTDCRPPFSRWPKAFTLKVIGNMIMSLEPDGEEQEKFREHHDILCNRENGSSVTWSEVNNMPYTNKVINETLRGATILPWFSRKAAQDFDIDGYKIQKGWSVNLDVVSIHHDPEIFPNPQKFDPSRFSDPIKPFSFLWKWTTHVSWNQPGQAGNLCFHPLLDLQIQFASVFLHCRWKPLERDDSVQPTLVRMPKNK